MPCVVTFPPDQAGREVLRVPVIAGSDQDCSQLGSHSGGGKWVQVEKAFSDPSQRKMQHRSHALWYSAAFTDVHGPDILILYVGVLPACGISIKSR